MAEAIMKRLKFDNDATERVKKMVKNHMRSHSLGRASGPKAIRKFVRDVGDELIDAVRAVYAGEPVLHPVVVRKLMTRVYSPQATAAEGQPQELLTQRELEVLMLAARGMSNKDIAEKLVISVRTVQAHLRSIFNKMGVGSRSEAVLQGLKRGWFSLEDLP
jgi:DNA-binding NarL/FixJ family response regulator